MKKVRRVKKDISLKVVDDGFICMIREGKLVLLKKRYRFKTSSENHSNFTGAYIESLDGEIQAEINLKMLS